MGQLQSYFRRSFAITIFLVLISSNTSQAQAAVTTVQDLFVCSFHSGVLRYDGATGGFLGEFVPNGRGGLGGPYDLTFGPDGNLYVTSQGPDAVLKFNGRTGEFLTTFVPPGSSGIPDGLVFGPDGNLYVASRSAKNVLRFDGSTGAFIDVFASGGALAGPLDLAFGPDGNLYVSSEDTHRVLKYDGTTGAYIGEFVTAGSGGLNAPEALEFGPDGNLYVTSRLTHSVLRYNGATGAFMDAFVASGSGGLVDPWGLGFGPEGVLYVTDGLASGKILRYDGISGAFIDEFVAAGLGGLNGPKDIAFSPTSQQLLHVPLPNLPEGARPLRMVRIPAGTFQMGSPETERGRDPEEGPVHTVTITRDFFMSEVEITQAMWKSVSNGTLPTPLGPGEGDDYPIRYTSWNGCQDWISTLNTLGLGSFRLPTEAEWEYACRAGTQTRFSFGDNLTCDDGCGSCAPADQYMWWCGNSGGVPHSVGLKLPNAWGLFDMHGNVFEWCQDWYDVNFYSKPEATLPNPVSLLSSNGGRQVRGGVYTSLGEKASGCRSAQRHNFDAPIYEVGYTGLRLVREVDPEIVEIPLPNLPEGARPLRFVKIPAGAFLMGNTGSTRDAQYGSSDEFPQHQVNINYDYFMGETEVTQAQWQSIMGNNPSTGTGDVGNDFPVYYVSWGACQDFITGLESQVGEDFRLPSEAEWEYACRGSAHNPNRYAVFSFGDDLSVNDLNSCQFSQLFDRYMWWCGNGSTTQPVAGKLPNDYGLYDMHGNDCEWCQDWWHDNYNGAPIDGSAWIGEGTAHVLRAGGNRNSWASTNRSASRSYHVNPDTGDGEVTLRLVLVDSTPHPTPTPTPGPGNCNYAVDTNHDCTISTSELLSFVGHWKNGEEGYNTSSLLEAAGIWKLGGSYGQ